MSEQLPDRLSTDPRSPYYNAEVLSRDVGIRGQDGVDVDALRFRQVERGV